MQKFFNILSSHKYALIWTLCYTLAMWCILYFLFKFNMFDITMWHHLFHAQLHGFPGFVFGILLLAALPLYIATTTLIIRNKKPLITIPVPHLPFDKIRQIFHTSTSPDTPPATTATTIDATPELTPDAIDTPTDLPPDMPMELRNAYLRARCNLGQTQTSIFNTPHPTSAPSTATVAPAPATDLASDEFPLPTDFDISVDPPTPDFDMAPTFTDITFDTNEPESPNTIDSGMAQLTDYLTATGRTFHIVDDIIITDTHAIITHADSDFWVSDSENWFAAGKTRPSPIRAVQDAAHEYNVSPVLYLASQNIMDLDKLIATWTSDGITVITSPTEI